MNRTCRSLALLAALLALPRARCDGAQAAAPSAPPVAALAGCTPAAAVPERALLQWGEPRSASTWQTRLLALLGRVRAAKACLPYCVEAALEDPLG